jgi:hypothetical protein
VSEPVNGVGTIFAILWARVAACGDFFRRLDLIGPVL